MRAISSAGITTPAAFAFSVTCSGREAPMIAVATLSFCSTHATASCASERSSSAAIGFRSCTRWSTSSCSQRLMKLAPPFSSVARLPAGSSPPGRYLPVSTPCAIGDQTTCEMPSSSDVGTTSPSITRQSAEYSGWFEISCTPSSFASAAPARSWSAVHSETPMYSTLPARTMSANAWKVSSSGVKWSNRCAW